MSEDAIDVEIEDSAASGHDGLFQVSWHNVKPNACLRLQSSSAFAVSFCDAEIADLTCHLGLLDFIKMFLYS